MRVVAGGEGPVE
jgi:hypothetical protein